jgi:hypothetical protein
VTRALLMLLTLAACHEGAPAKTKCESNDACPAGQICQEGSCAQLCVSSLDCGQAQICGNGGVCEPGSREAEPPSIQLIEGDGSSDCPATPGTNCLEGAVIVVGSGLEEATFELRSSSGQSYTLATRGARLDERATLILPNVAPGSYVLTAVNAAGADETSLTLLQGPQGPQGPPGPAGSGGGGGDLPSPDELVGLINASTAQLDTSILPLGSRYDQVAPGDHVHDASDLVTGMITVAQLPIGLNADQVAPGNHTHAGFAPVMHNHDDRYVRTLTTSATYSIDSVNGAGLRSVPMTAAARSMCFLTLVSMVDLDGGSERASCHVSDIGGTWTLYAQTASGDDNDAYCQAHCLTW